MSNAMKLVLENIKELSSHEKATLAHCLISSLDEVSDKNVDDAWLELAAARLAQLESGEVQAISWAQIKRGLKGGA